MRGKKKSKKSNSSKEESVNLTAFISRLGNFISQHPLKALILFIFLILSMYLKFHEANVGIGDEFKGSDPEAYHTNALTFLNGEGPISSWHNPLETIYLIVVYSIFGVNPFTARVIQILLSFLIPFFIFKFTKKFFGAGPAFFAALLALVEYNIVYYSAHLWDMIWVILFLSWLLYLFSENKDKQKMHRKTYFFMGLLGIIGALAKIWVLAAAIVLLCFLFYYQNNKKINFNIIKNSFLPLLLFAVGVLIILIPWSLHASMGVGYFVFINQNSALNYYMGNNPNEEVAMTSMYDWSYAYDTQIDEGNCGEIIQNLSYPKYNKYFIECLGTYTNSYILHNPGKLIKKWYVFTTKYWLFPNLEWYQRNIRDPGYLMFMQWFFFIFGTIGFILTLGKFKQLLPFYLIWAGIWLSYAMTVYLARYKSSYVPISVMFTAVGLYSVWYFIKKFFSKEKDEKNK